jgi:hypothetical protein
MRNNLDAPSAKRVIHNKPPKLLFRWACLAGRCAAVIAG